MKTSVSFFTFSQDVDYREAMEESKKAGYDGVEFVLNETDGNLNMKTTDQEVMELKKYATDLGLEVSSVGAWNLWEYNLVSDDKAIASHAKDIIKKQIDVAQICGADTILVIPGYVGTPFAPGIVRYDIAYERAMKAISELAPYAEAAKVAIGIENVWNKFLLSPIEVKSFLDEINSPYVGAYFDIGNIIYIGYPDQWIRILDKHIKKLHFCDCRFDQCGLGMFVDLLEGDVDYVEVMHAIKDIGYDDWAIVEFLPNYKTFPYQSIINAKYSLDTILSIK
ncbi:MAG: sugar phosphate isomerase/epimerase [Actinomycetota bacterium]|nr:sugar phosphate isomerase/epimerase [Actinomycetota bacterium]